MKKTIQKTMKAVAIDHFGDIDVMKVQTLPIPEVDSNEILIRVHTAGIGVWDPFERKGGFAEMYESEPHFPYILGSDGSGVVEIIGEDVTWFKKGDKVYAINVMNPKGGFYSQYTTVKESDASLIPANLSLEQAGVLAVDAITALRGLDDSLQLKKGESILIFGASGGIGHLAVQLAKRMGARVFAVASGSDGVKLVKKLGADAVVDGHKDDVASAARQFEPKGLDAALLTAGGEAAQKALEALRDGGRVAYPNGVHPEPEIRSSLSVKTYNGDPDREVIDKLNGLIESGPFQVYVAHVYSLSQIAEAHQMLKKHFLGKLALRPD